MTVRLYYTDATVREFTARVTASADEGRTVFLDRTAFYPTSGGQPNDLGTLAGIAVTDVVDQDDTVAHHLAEPLAAGAGTEVRGAIDWPRRHDHMQQHTGQHLLSAVLEDALGLATASVHFGAAASTLDVAGPGGRAEPLDPATLAAIERRANEIVAEARPVTVSFEDAATALGLRKPSERSGELRIVTIAGLDRSACGGTHVATTAAIGPILLRRQEKVKAGLRIEFVCGGRALDRTRRDLALLQQAARTFSGAIDDVPLLVAAQADTLRRLQADHDRDRDALAAYRAAELVAGAATDSRGVRWVVERAAGAGADTLRALALAVAALPRTAFVGASAAPPSVLFATAGDAGIEAGRTLKPLLERAGGRGGGSPRLAQGSLPDATAVDRVVDWLTRGPADALATPPESR